MSSRPRQLQTLPPDGLVLDELISDLISEYGAPATPQDYRLIIRLPAEDEPGGEASEGDEPATTQGQTETSEVQEISSIPAPRRRRRRGRRGRPRPDSLKEAPSIGPAGTASIKDNGQQSGLNPSDQG